MECPNGCGEMEWARQYIIANEKGTYVEVWICEKCDYAEAHAV
jgi:hypothetical protein